MKASKDPIRRERKRRSGFVRVVCKGREGKGGGSEELGKREREREVRSKRKIDSSPIFGKKEREGKGKKKK